MIIFHLVNYFCPLKAPVSLLEVIDIYFTRKHFTLTERDNRDNRDIAFVIQKQFTKMVVNTSNSPLGYSHSGEIYPEGCMIVTIKNSVADLILHFLSLLFQPHILTDDIPHFIATNKQLQEQNVSPFKKKIFHEFIDF